MAIATTAKCVRKVPGLPSLRKMEVPEEVEEVDSNMSSPQPETPPPQELSMDEVRLASVWEGGGAYSNSA